MDNTIIERLKGYEKQWIISNDLDTSAIFNEEYAVKFACDATFRNENEHKFFSIERFNAFDVWDYINERRNKNILI